MFKLSSKYKPSGDQPQAINTLIEGINNNKKHQVLLGATGTGKTFTIANVINQINKPTLVFAHNKTLAGQLYSELKELFPDNRVEYFVSNFDYYQPEAYVAKTDTYIEKTAMMNEELDMLRMSAVNAALEREDTIIVASVACIYGASNPEDYKGMFFTIKVNEKITREQLLQNLVLRQYVRNDHEAKRGSFMVKGETIDISLGHTDDYILRIEMFDDQIERITEIDPITKKTRRGLMVYSIFPAIAYARNRESITVACNEIEQELQERLKYFKDQDKHLEYERLNQRCSYDLESLREFGVCSGVENYSRYFNRKKSGERPYNLFDYFPKDFLMIIDESHVSIPQIKGMYFGDRSRKETLVQYGFRLPSALDNRPMKFDEFNEMINQVIYVSATPGDYELNLVNNEVVEQIIRPTGLIDPLIDVRPTDGQIDDILDEIKECVNKNERVLITALTVKMAEDLTSYLLNEDIKVTYLHHEVKTLQRIETVLDLRKGNIDVLVGINLLREGLDIPEVSKVIILDADKEGFLRSQRSLIQTIGRAARNSNGHVIMYADKITDSMKIAIDETNRRRNIQQQYNIEHNIIPKTIKKEIHEAIHGKETKELTMKFLSKTKKTDNKKLEDLLIELKDEMKLAAKELNFERAAELRDIIMDLSEQ